MKTLASPIADPAPVRIELPKADSRKSAGTNISLGDLEQELTRLEAAFGELERLRTIAADAQKAFEQACEEEKQCLSNGELSEKDAIRRLVEVRAKKDLRNQRLLDAGRKVELQIDLLIYDVGEPLRHRFTQLAHQLFGAKEHDLREEISRLFPNGCGGLPITPEQLLDACAPLVPYRQLLNWVRIEFPKDSIGHLEELHTLPGKWLQRLYELS